MANWKKKFQNRNQIAEILETKDKKEQLERVQALMQAAATPVYDIVIRFDPRNGNYGFSVIGGQLDLGQAIEIMDKGLDELRAEYIEQQNKKAEAEMQDKMKAESAHKSEDKIVLVQHESEENKKKRLEVEEQTADESSTTKVVEAQGDDGESARD